MSSTYERRDQTAGTTPHELTPEPAARKRPPFFPAALPDETLASRVSRYHVQRGHQTTHATYRELFESAPFSLTYWVPPKLERLAAKLPGRASDNLTALYRESTLLPLFQQFAGGRYTVDRAAGSAEAAAVELPRRIVGESGTTHLCPTCLVDDLQEWGTSYIHREHQIPGITCCWKHGVKLIDRCPICRCPFESPKNLILGLWQSCHCGNEIIEVAPSVHEEAPTSEVEFAQFAMALLPAPGTAISTDALVALYRHRARELGFSRGSNINRIDLFAAVEEHFGAELLARIDPAYRADRRSGWFHVLCPSAAADVPVNRHLALAAFLFREANLFIQARDTASAEWQVRRQAKPRLRETSIVDPASTAGIPKTADALIDKLTSLARRHGLDVDALWVRHFAMMKRAVRVAPDAAAQIEARLATRPIAGTAAIGASALRDPTQDATDARWAEALQRAAAGLYAGPGKPVKVTKHRIVNATLFRGESWPSADAFPRSRAALETHEESIWHFYMRRLLWALNVLGSADVAKCNILSVAGIEHHKGEAVLQYLVRTGATHKAAIAPAPILPKQLDIPTNWIGPCPERTFQRAGRGYVPRRTKRHDLHG